MFPPNVQPVLERVLSVLHVYENDFSFCPRREDLHFDSILNPKHDRLRGRILRLDSIINWRLKVSKAMRTQSELRYPQERRWRRSYMTNHEKTAFDELIKVGKWNHLSLRAVRKVDRNFSRLRVYFGE